jgi:hypothetical protein
MYKEILEALNIEAQIFIANWDAAMHHAGSPPVAEQVIKVLDEMINGFDDTKWTVNQLRFQALLKTSDTRAYHAIAYPRGAE